MTTSETTPTHTEQAIRYLVPEIDRWGDVQTTARRNGHSEYDMTALTTDALIGSGHALLAIHAELAGIRAALTRDADTRNEITTAINGLTSALRNLDLTPISEVAEELHKMRPVPHGCGCMWRGDIRVRACRDHKKVAVFARLWRRWTRRPKAEQ